MPRSAPGLHMQAVRERKMATLRDWRYSSLLKCRPETILSMTKNALVLNLERNTICAVNKCDYMERDGAFGASGPRKHQFPRRHHRPGDPSRGTARLKM